MKLNDCEWMVDILKSVKLTLKVVNFWKFTSYCSLKPLWSGMGEGVLARTSPTLHPPSPPTVHQLSRLALWVKNSGRQRNLQLFCAVFLLHVWNVWQWSFNQLELYLFIAPQTAQVVWLIWIALTGQHGQSGSNKEIQPKSLAQMCVIRNHTFWHVERSSRCSFHFCYECILSEWSGRKVVGVIGLGAKTDSVATFPRIVLEIKRCYKCVTTATYITGLWQCSTLLFLLVILWYRHGMYCCIYHGVYIGRNGKVVNTTNSGSNGTVYNVSSEAKGSIYT